MPLQHPIETSDNLTPNQSKTSVGSIIGCALIIICAIGMSIWALAYNDQEPASLMHQYNQLHKKPYITLQENKKLFNKANLAEENGDAVIKKMDGTIVVDNKDGHEYLVNTTISRDRRSNAQYQLVPKTNGKSAVINKAWLKKHKQTK